MPLRDADEVGVPDVRRFASLQVTEDARERPASVKQVARRATRPKHSVSPKALAALPATDAASQVDAPAAAPASSQSPVSSPSAAPGTARVPLSEERLVHLQADVPEEALRRVKTVSFELADVHAHLSRHQTILGALVWAHVDHADQGRLDELADLIDAYRFSPWHGLPEPRRLSGRMPASLKRRVEGTVLALEHTQRDASAKLLVAALVWRHVVSSHDDQAGFARLIDTLGGYHQELTQRSYSPPVASAKPHT